MLKDVDDVEFRILGPLEASVEGRPVPLGGPKQRALLALLLVHAGTVVAADELIDEVWGADAPPTVRAGLQVYLSRLRRTLGSDRGNELLVRHAYGYALMIDPDRLDAERFEQLAREGRDALAEGQVAQAAETLSRALSIWRGPALADLARVPFAQAEARRLEDLRLQAIEHRITAELRLGRSSDVVSELEGLVAAHPYREGLRAQLMLALYRSGRQVEALEAYAAARRVLSDDLGLEPGYALRQLEQAILQHDQVLELAPAAAMVERAPTDATRHPDDSPSRADLAAGAAALHDPALGPLPHVIRRESRTMRGRLALVAAAAAALIAGLIGIAASQSEPTVMLPPRSLALVDPATLELRAVISLNGAPSDLAVGRRAVFVALPGRRSVVAVDPSSRAARRSVQRSGLGAWPPGRTVSGCSTRSLAEWRCSAPTACTSSATRLRPERRRLMRSRAPGETSGSPSATRSSSTGSTAGRVIRSRSGMAAPTRSSTAERGVRWLSGPAPCGSRTR